MPSSAAAAPLLGNPVGKAHTARNVFIFFLTVVAVTSIATFISSYRITTSTFIDSNHLCSTSPNPSTCHVIVSSSLLSSNGNSNPSSPLHVVKSIAVRSVHHLEATARAFVKAPTGIPAVADCIHLLDLSRDRLLASSSAAGASATEDAQTWLSAAMTFHDTCLDGLRDIKSETEIEARIEALQDMVSAALAVIGSTKAHDTPVDVVSRAFLGRFPSWVTEEDRRILEEDPAKLRAAADAVVAKDGSGRYTTVQAALSAAPSNSASRYVIYVKRGTYKETVRVAKKQINIMILGDGAGATVITGSLNNVDGTTTFQSATLASDADGFILQDVTVENTAGAAKHQAVALRVSGDKSVVYKCNLEAYQDTLYTHALRQFFRDSYVSGTVDFIFGNAGVVFQNSKLVARKPDRGQKNAVTAQGRTDPNQNTGTSIQNCQVIPSSDLAPVTGSFPTYLGRPWKLYSRTVYMQSTIDSHVAAAGWLEWDGTTGLDTLYYAEYANTGAGASTSGRVKWKGYHILTSSSDALPFTVDKLIQGSSWLPATGVPFKSGL